MSRQITDYVLGESTRAYIEKMVASWLAEDQKDPAYRRMVQEITRPHYEGQMRKLRRRGRRQKRRK